MITQINKIAWIILIFLIFISACSDVTNQDSKEERSQQVLSSSRAIEKNTLTFKISLLKRVNSQLGDYTIAKYEIDNPNGSIDYTGRLSCVDTTLSIICTATLDLGKTILSQGIYRFRIRSGNGLLGSDYFEITPNIKRQITISIDNESTGNYILSQLIKLTGLSEEEIYNRLSIKLTNDGSIKEYKPHMDYDLEVTLYNIFNSLEGYRNADYAIKKLIAALQNHQPLEMEPLHQPATGGGVLAPFV